MSRRKIFLVVPFLLGSFAVFLAQPVLAGFEGILHEKFTSPHANGTADIYVSKSGFRQEMSFGGPRGAMNMVSIMNTKNHDKVYILNDASKTYREIDTSNARKAVQKTPEEKFTVKPLGDLKVAGLNCKNVLITGQRMGEMEWCATQELVDEADFAKFRSSDPHSKTSESFMKAVQDAGAAGVPIRTVTHGRHGEDMTMELVKVEKKSLPASLFQLPEGYTKQEGFAAPGAPMSPDTENRMKEGMKNLSPEQKEMIEKMMNKPK